MPARSKWLPALLLLLTNGVAFAGPVEDFTEAFTAGTQAYQKEDFAEAERSFAKAANSAMLAAGGKRPIQWVQCEEFRAQCLTELLELDEAIRVYRNCIEYSKTHEQDQERIHRCRDGIATCLTWLNQWEDAEKIYQEHVRDFDGIQDHLNLAWLYHRWGRFKKAEAEFRVVLLRNPSKDHIRQSALHGLGFVALEQRNIIDAQSHFEQSQEISSSLGLKQGQMQAKAMLGVTYAVNGEHQTAAGLLTESMREMKKQRGPDHPETAEIEHELALTQYQLGNIGPATDTLHQSRQRYHRFLTNMLRSLSGEGQYRFLEVENRRLMDAIVIGASKRQSQDAAPTLPLEWVINSKGLITECSAQRAQLVKKLTPGDANYSKAKRLQAIRQEMALLIFTPNADKQRLQQLRAEEANLTLGLDMPTQASTWVEVSQLQKALSEDEILVEFFRVDRKEPSKSAFVATTQNSIDDRYLTWIITRSDVKAIDLGSATFIDNQIAKVRREIANASSPNGSLRQEGEPTSEAEIKPLLHDLQRLVWEPIAQHLPDRIQEITLAPDGQLWLLPWSALVMNDNSYFVESHAYRLVISGRDVVNPHSGFSSKPAVLFANPTYDLQQNEKRQLLDELSITAVNQSDTVTRSLVDIGKASPLEFTETEARAVFPHLQTVTGQTPQLFLRDQALEQNVKKVSQPRMVHLSTHGFFKSLDHAQSTTGQLQFSSSKSEENRSLNPLLRCGLLFAGCNLNTSVNGDDGILTGMEIVDLDLRGTECVFLSACETGLGDVHATEGVAGLRQAFQLAGANKVVATLWLVPDRDSALLMKDYLSNLAEGQSLSRALQQAQVERIRNHRQRFGASHPFYWAAWTLTGR